MRTMVAGSGPLRRIAARGIDEALVLVIQVAFLVPAVVLSSTEGADHRREELAVTAFCLVFMGWFVGVCYEVSSNQLAGTPGKRQMQLRVFAAGTRDVLSLQASIVRWALVNGAQPLVWCAVGVVVVDSTPARATLAGLTAASLLWRAVLLVSVVRSGGATGLHDRLVGSHVVAALPHEAAAAASDETGMVAGAAH